jgi:hypothetical protein
VRCWGSQCLLMGLIVSSIKTKFIGMLPSMRKEVDNVLVLMSASSFSLERIFIFSTYDIYKGFPHLKL